MKKMNYQKNSWNTKMTTIQINQTQTVPKSNMKRSHLPWKRASEALANQNKWLFFRLITEYHLNNLRNKFKMKVKEAAIIWWKAKNRCLGSWHCNQILFYLSKDRNQKSWIQVFYLSRRLEKVSYLSQREQRVS